MGSMGMLEGSRSNFNVEIVGEVEEEVVVEQEGEEEEEVIVEEEVIEEGVLVEEEEEEEEKVVEVVVKEEFVKVGEVEDAPEASEDSHKEEEGSCKTKGMAEGELPKMLRYSRVGGRPSKERGKYPSFP